MTILLGSLFDTLVLSILVGLKNHLGFSVTQVRPFINSEVEIGVFALICRPKSCPLLGVLHLPNNLIPRNSYKELFECFFRDTMRHYETTALITITVTEYKRRDLTVV